jgi:hypothetical protein
MKKIVLLLTVLLMIISSKTFSQEKDKKLTLSIYGNVLYQHFDYGPNQRAAITGSKEDDRAIMDVPKFVVAPAFYFDSTFYIDSEIEFEHLGTGSSMEIEYEEFGEYEFESEKGGEVQLEEIHLNKLFMDEFNVRIGRFPLALTLFNDRHRPMAYFSNKYPESESTILPTVWTETGIEIFGKAFNFNYNLALVNGLDAAGFSSDRWISEGHQHRYELIKASNLAGVLRLNYSGIVNTSLGFGVYYGNSADNRPKPEDMDGIDATVSIFSLHGRYDNGALRTRADLIYGNLNNSNIVSERNARLSVNSQYPRTPVAKNALAWYVELGYDIAPLISLPQEYQLFPFGKYEFYNSMYKVVGGVFANPRFERSLYTFGFNLIWKNQVVFKADYTTRIIDRGNYNTENTISVGVGFMTSIIK